MGSAVTHHTDAQGADFLVDEAAREIERAVDELLGPGQGTVARSEVVRMALLECVIATRRNDPLRRMTQALSGAGLGAVARGALVQSVLRNLQDAARGTAPYSGRPLPLGIATPVPAHADGDDDLDRTPVPGPAVNAIEVDATPHNAPTRPVLVPPYWRGPRGKR